MAQLWDNPDEKEDTLGTWRNGFELKSWGLIDTWPWEFEPQQDIDKFWKEMQTWTYPASMRLMLSDESIGIGVNFELLMFQMIMPPEFDANIAKLSPVFFPGMLFTLMSAFVMLMMASWAEKTIPSCPKKLLPWQSNDVLVEIRQMWFDPDEICKTEGICWIHFG